MSFCCRKQPFVIETQNRTKRKAATMSTPNVKRFILLGDTGAGKSTFINFLWNFYYGSTNSDEIFCKHPSVRLAIPCANWLDCLEEKYQEGNTEHNINDQTQSQTKDCSLYLFQSKKISCELELIDTPGFNDTNGTQDDEDNLNCIEKALRSVPHLNGIMLVVNGTIPRIGASFHNFLHSLQQVWPNDLLTNCIVILTNCDELTVSFKKSILKNSFNVQEDCIFTFQNSLFRWDQKTKSPKTIGHYKENFEDSVQKVNLLLKKLVLYIAVSTESFKISAIKIDSIEKSIIQSVRNMIRLVKCYKEQIIAHDAIDGARMTMDDNRTWTKKQEIYAIVWEHMAGNHARSSSPRALPQHAMATNMHAFDNETYGQVSLTERVPNQKTPSIRPVKSPEKSEHIPDVGKSDYMDCGTGNDGARRTHSGDSNQSQRKSIPDGNKNSYGKDAGNDLHRQPNAHLPSPSSPPSFPSTYKPENKQRAPTNPWHEPTYQQKHTVLEINLPDNEARMTYMEAERQATMLKNRTQELEKKQRTLSGDIESQLAHLRRKVNELWVINSNYDVLERNKNLLQEFAEIVKLEGTHSAMERYFEETVQILTKPADRLDALRAKRES